MTSAESDLAESPRKRSHGSTTDGPLGAEETVAALREVAEGTEQAEETPRADNNRDTPSIPTKALKGRKGRVKGKKQKEIIEGPETEQIKESEQQQEEPTEENVAKTEEELKAKKEASNLYEDVAKQFRSFKEKLYNERLKAITAELQLLGEPNCVHPEYLRQIACVDTRLQKQLSETRAFYNYKLRCIKERTLGERSQLHSQYYQHVRDLRENALEKLGEEWYAIQRERRQSHQEMDDAYVLKFPEKKGVQIRQQAKYNQEVSVLSGAAKYVGFPAAPEINGAENRWFREGHEGYEGERERTYKSNTMCQC